MTLSKRRNVVALKVFFLSFQKALNRFFRVFNRDGFNLCPVAIFHSEVIDKAHSFTYFELL